MEAPKPSIRDGNREYGTLETEKSKWRVTIVTDAALRQVHH
jgi:hypothetical protein